MITIYTKTLRSAVCADVSESDVSEYDAHESDYIEFVKAEAKKYGHEVDVDDDIGGRSYTTDSTDEDDAMQMIPSFWDWYQSAP